MWPVGAPFLPFLQTIVRRTSTSLRDAMPSRIRKIFVEELSDSSRRNCGSVRILRPGGLQSDIRRSGRDFAKALAQRVQERLKRHWIASLRLKRAAVLISVGS